VTRSTNCLGALLACFVTACATRGAPSSTLPIGPGRETAVDEYVSERMRAMRVPGLALAVLQNGRLVKASGYGLANLETNAPATPATAFRIASLSKQFIATAVMLLVQDEKLRLDDRAAQYLDGAPATWSDITIRQLLAHTSGIVRDPPDYHPYVEQPITDVIQTAYGLPLASRPGEKFLYSNIGYYVLAAVIAKASGQPWDAFIATRLFAPARMTSTRMGTVRDVVPNRASGYQLANGALVNAESWIAMRPSSAFISTVLDLAAWDAFLDAGDPLTPANRRLMRTPARLNDGSPVDYGFGWAVDTLFGRTRIHHDGQYPGFRADYERFEDDGLTVIVLANTDRANVQSLAIKVAGFYAPVLTTPPFTISVEAPVGTVADSSQVAIHVVAKNDGQAARNTQLEMEIWDADNKAVFKQQKLNESFDAGQAKSFTFTWTPTRPGTYWVNIGTYGPKWAVSYAWNEHAAAITVR
jgi:D-alanyl-D-alanine carboxypeptidase